MQILLVESKQFVLIMTSISSLYRYTLTGETCSLVSAGTYATYVLPGFTECPTGQISISAGSVSCLTCSSGKYSSSDHTECLDCQDMTFSVGNVNTCLPCIGGGTSCDPLDGGTTGGW